MTTATLIPQSLAHARPSASTAGLARQRLEEKIATGRLTAMALIERINTDAPRDQLVRGKSMDFGAGQDQLAMALGAEGDEMIIHRHALGQLASKAGIPGAYLADLAAEGGWKRELGVEILRRHYHDGEESMSRMLVRSVKGEVRGVLSDKYRRLDSRPLVEAFAGECAKVGAVPVDGTCSDTRVALKALIPVVYEPVPGEVVAFGVEWANSDYGNGIHALRAFMLRLLCLNGATLENALAQIHLGGRMSDEFELSQRTYELDTKTSVSALRDVVQGVLAPAKVEAMVAGIARAHDKGVEWKHVKTSLAKRLLKTEMAAAEAAFESEDVINLPAGRSMWRASNAISWIAGNAQDMDRRLELERLAGELVSGKRDVETVA